MWCISSQIIVTQQPLRNTLSLCPCNSKTSKLNCDVYILFRAAKYKKNKMALNCFYRFVWILETNIPWYADYNPSGATKLIFQLQTDKAKC